MYTCHILIFFFSFKANLLTFQLQRRNIVRPLGGSSLTVHAFDALAIMLYKSNVISPGSCTNIENSIKDAAFPQVLVFQLAEDSFISKHAGITDWLH